MTVDPQDWRRNKPAAHIYAEVIGDPISQSKSPVIHRFWLHRVGIDADYRATHVRPEHLHSYLDARRDDPFWRGCNVTMPHKQAVIAHLDRLTPLAKRIGAVNTIFRDQQGYLVGDNTDAPGFGEPLQRLCIPRLSVMRVLVLGGGGAARAVISFLDDALSDGNSITLAVRDEAKGWGLLGELNGELGAVWPVNHGDMLPGSPTYDVVDLNRFAKLPEGAAPFNLVVNTSPLGMVGYPPLAFDLSYVALGGVVYDIVTAPPETPLLKAAREQHLLTIDGLAMLMGQARGAFARFFMSDHDNLVDMAWDDDLRRILGA